MKIFLVILISTATGSALLASSSNSPTSADLSLSNLDLQGFEKLQHQAAIATLLDRIKRVSKDGLHKGETLEQIVAEKIFKHIKQIDSVLALLLKNGALKS